MQLKPISEQVVVVFGASSGIGRETARHFAREGAKVVVAARSEEGLRSLVEEIRRDGGEGSYVVADVADFDQVEAVAEHAVATYGRLDTWVHAAAISLYATFRDTTVEEFKRVIEVNLIGQVHGAKAALPHLIREGRGALIHISSVEAKVPLPYQSAYASSKHGIAGFLDALRLELEHDGLPISVTNVMPASINTPLFNHARTKLGVQPKGLPPIYEPEIVARAILHAAEHPARDVIVGDAGKMMVMGKKLSPHLTDAMLSATGFKGQKTDNPESADGPDNFYAPMEGYNTAKGDFGAQSLPISVTNWLERLPLGQRLLLAVATGVIAGVALRPSSDGKITNGATRLIGAVGLSANERTIRELNALIETHLDAVEVLRHAEEGAESSEVREVVQKMLRDHQSAARRLQQRVAALGGRAAADAHATNKLKESWQAMWKGGGDKAVLLALRANERVSVDGFKAQLLKEGVLQTMTDEGLREHRDALDMELRHFQSETDMLRERGAAVDNDEIMGAMRNAAEHLHAAINLSGTAVEAFLKYATGTASR